jgi:Flp pilus assembly pilin Flp
MAEYAMLTAFVGVASIASVGALGGDLSALFERNAAAFNEARTTGLQTQGAEFDDVALAEGPEEGALEDLAPQAEPERDGNMQIVVPDYIQNNRGLVDMEGPLPKPQTIEEANAVIAEKLVLKITAEDELLEAIEAYEADPGFRIQPYDERNNLAGAKLAEARANLIELETGEPAPQTGTEDQGGRGGGNQISF